MTETQSCYTALDKDLREIRLLTIQPDPHPKDNRIQCKLSTHNLDDNLQYEALSYAWGAPEENDFKIWVNGNWNGVRRNLLCALRVLRGKTPRVLWIDALCINQGDVLERGHQVRLMGPIYQRASRVLVWLGPLDARELNDEHLDTLDYQLHNATIPAFELLAASHAMEADPDLQPESWAQRFTPRRWHDEQYWQTDEAYIGENGKWEDGFYQLVQLCEVEYWNRMWIMQEICLASHITVLYGSASIRWARLSQFLSRVRNVPHPYLADLVRLVNLQVSRLTRLVRQHSPKTLSTLIDISINCLCQDSRDKIYGLLALAADVSEHDIPISYSQDATDLYRSVLMFQAKKPAGPLNRKSLFWFSRTLRDTLLLDVDAGRTLKYVASETVSDRLTDGTYAPVVRLSPILTEDTIFSQEMLPNAVRNNHITQNTTRRISSATSMHWKRYWEKFLDKRHVALSDKLSTAESSKVFVTEDWYIGLGPNSIRDGDVLCCLSNIIVRLDGSQFDTKSTDWPLLAVIREVASPYSSTWSFVGGAVLSDYQLFHEAGGTETVEWPLAPLSNPPLEVNVYGLPKDILACCERLQHTNSFNTEFHYE